jgi:hypothetical protein
MASQIITQDQVKDLFEYRDGVLYRKVNTSPNARAGDKAGTLNGNGRIYTRVNSQKYLSHRIIFLMFYGYLPQFIDHIDGNPLNNRIDNLRPVTSAENNRNAKIRKNNTSGVKGVCWYKAGQKWQVQLQVDGGRKFFGYYSDIELAELVAIEARNKYHQNYARHF